MMIKMKTVGFAILLAFFVFCVGMALFYFFNAEETKISNENTSKTISLLKCESNDPFGLFFVFDARKSSHEIKITFRNDKADKISYDFEGIYEDESLASGAKTKASIKYNLDMSDNNLRQSSISTTFNYTNNIMRVYLVSEINKLNQVTAKYFLLKTNEYPSISEMSNDQLKQLYENKNFTCEYQK